MKLGKRFRAYKRDKKKRYKRGIFFSIKSNKYKTKKVKCRISILTRESKKNLRKEFFSKDFWKTAFLYSKMEFFKSKKVKKKIWFNLLNKSTTKFLKNSDAITQNQYQNIEKKNNIINKMKRALIKGYNKSKYLSRLNFTKYFYKKFLLVNDLNFKQHPTDLYAKTIKLKYFKPKFRKRVESLQKMYSYYYFISNNLRKSRVFHESFFYNLPSNFTFIRSFHKYDKPSWYLKRDTDRFGNKWHWYNENHRYLMNDRSQNYWATNRRNTMLFKYWKYNKKLTIADSAIVYPLTRWVTERRKLNLMRIQNRFLLTYWLIPFFRPFIVKEKNRWYKARFFKKEDDTILQHFNWNWPYYKTPLTTFHYYNNWFTFLLQEKEYFRRQNYSSTFQNIESWRRRKSWRSWKLKRAKLKKAKKIVKTKYKNA